MNISKFINIQKKIRMLSLEFGFCKTIELVGKKLLYHSKYDDEIIKLLKNENIDIIEKYKKMHCNKVEQGDINKKVWIFWWQGIDEMPPIVEKCIRSVYMHSNKHEVVLLTKYNYTNYIDIPIFIIEKFRRGNISITHFSDILRIGLLKNWGGVWIDATILLTDNLDDLVFKMPFYSRRTNHGSKFVSDGRWSSYFMAGDANNIIFCMLYDILCRYWKNHNIMIDYLSIDYTLALCYENVSQIKQLILSVPQNNARIHELASRINDKYDAVFFTDLCKETKLHKLSWKQTYSELNRKGEVTFFGYILNMFL